MRHQQLCLGAVCLLVATASGTSMSALIDGVERELEEGDSFWSTGNVAPEFSKAGFWMEPGILERAYGVEDCAVSDSHKEVCYINNRLETDTGIEDIYVMEGVFQGSFTVRAFYCQDDDSNTLDRTRLCNCNFLMNDSICPYCDPCGMQAARDNSGVLFSGETFFASSAEQGADALNVDQNIRIGLAVWVALAVAMFCLGCCVVLAFVLCRRNANTSSKTIKEASNGRNKKANDGDAVTVDLESLEEDQAGPSSYSTNEAIRTPIPHAPPSPNKDKKVSSFSIEKSVLPPDRARRPSSPIVTKSCLPNTQQPDMDGSIISVSFVP